MMQKRKIKALTIRKLPDRVADAVHKRAEESHLSFSRALISLLEDRMKEPGKIKKKRDLSYIAGSWSDEEAKEFNEVLADQRKVDPGMWT